uniref:Uncharacterized protein n=1 Tax=Rhizophora mucronata TaxID=61149 RepID=A0A2P2IUP6_RHIMU
MTLISSGLLADCDLVGLIIKKKVCHFVFS